MLWLLYEWRMCIDILLRAQERCRTDVYQQLDHLTTIHARLSHSNAQVGVFNMVMDAGIQLCHETEKAYLEC